eukprot:3239090-Pyramimonas_sp.AAC.1
MHAWARRIITRLGTQTHRPNFFDVSARSVQQQHKRRSAEINPWRPPQARPPDTHDTAADDAGDEAEQPPARKQPRRTGGGGAWRSHVSRMWRQKITDPVAVKEAWLNRTDAEKLQDAVDGKHATELLTLRVSPPAHPETVPTRVEVIREVKEHAEEPRAGATVLLQEREDGVGIGGG